MKTLIYSDGKVYHLGEMEPVQEGVPCLLSGGKGVWNPGKDHLFISRHRVTPVDPDDKHAVAMKLGLEAYDAYHLAKYPGRVLGIMRKRDRPVGAGYIWMGTGELRGENTGRHLDQFCIAIAPEPVEKTTEDCLAGLAKLIVENGGIGGEIYAQAQAAQAHLDKMNDPSA